MTSYVPVCLLIFVIIQSGVADRVRDKIYYDSGVINTCFIRLNATHQFGCSSARGGNVGILHYVEDESDITWMIEHGPHAPYVVLLAPLMFKKDTVHLLQNSTKVNGILVIYNASHHLDNFSPDSKCPNSNFELYRGDEEFAECKKNVWNPQGNGLIFENINLPIVVLHNQTHVDFFIHDCYEKYNKPLDNVSRQYPLCGAEVLAAMDAVKDTPTCLRKGEPRNLNPQSFCDPLGDYNVYSFLKPIPSDKEPLQNKSLIVAAARLDVAGMFENLYPAADATVVGFISLLAAAEALGKVKESIDKPIMFSFFQGEAFDYIGSGRMVHDMQQGKFPYKLKEGTEGPHPIHPHHIGHFLEVSQIALPEENTLWMHSDPRSRRNENINETTSRMEDIISKQAGSLGIDVQPTDNDLPLLPSSLHSFLRQANFSGVVMADHHKEYNNRFYSGRFDLAKNLDYNINITDNMTIAEMQYVKTELSHHLTNISTLVARSLYELSTDKEEPKISANESIVAQLLFCFFHTPRCDLFNFTLLEDETSSHLPEKPYDFYVMVDHQSHPVTSHVYRLMAYFTGTIKQDMDKDKCEDATSPYYQYIWMKGPVNHTDPTQKRIGICVETTANRSIAKSLAFEDGYDWSSNLYPAWSESVWPGSTPNVRVFLIPDHNYEISCLCGGLAVFLSTFLVIFMCQRRGDILFGRLHTLLPTDPDA